MVAVCLWCIEETLSNFLMCRPISFNWDFSQKGTCGNILAGCVTGAVINVITDLVILILPLIVIWGLGIPTKSKLSLSIIFSLGSLYVAPFLTLRFKLDVFR